MPAIARSPSAAMCSSPSAGRMSAAASTSSPPPAPRRSPARRSSASPNSTPSRPRSAAAAPTSGAPSRQERSRPIVDALEPWLRAKLGLISQKTKLAEAIRYALSRWEGLTRFLDDGRIEIDSNVVERAHPADRAQPQECALRRLRRRRRALGGHRLADRDLQAQRRRPAGLPRRRHHQDRQRPSQQPDRRSPALGLSRHPSAQSRGLKTPLTVKTPPPPSYGHTRCGAGVRRPWARRPDHACA